MTNETALSILTDHLSELEENNAPEDLLEAITMATDAIGEKIDRGKRSILRDRIIMTPSGDTPYASLSAEAKKFIKMVRPNPYHSMMSILKTFCGKSQEPSKDKVMSRYLILHPTSDRHMGVLNEILDACYVSAKKKGWY